MGQVLAYDVLKLIGVCERHGESRSQVHQISYLLREFKVEEFYILRFEVSEGEPYSLELESIIQELSSLGLAISKDHEIKLSDEGRLFLERNPVGTQYSELLTTICNLDPMLLKNSASIVYAERAAKRDLRKVNVGSYSEKYAPGDLTKISAVLAALERYQLGLVLA